MHGPQNDSPLPHNNTDTKDTQAHTTQHTYACAYQHTSVYTLHMPSIPTDPTGTCTDTYDPDTRENLHRARTLQEQRPYALVSPRDYTLNAASATSSCSARCFCQRLPQAPPHPSRVLPTRDSWGLGAMKILYHGAILMAHVLQLGPLPLPTFHPLGNCYLLLLSQSLP